MYKTKVPLKINDIREAVGSIPISYTIYFQPFACHYALKDMGWTRSKHKIKEGE